MPGSPSPSGHEQPCIRCGDCATVCPAQLQPQRLLLQLHYGHLHDAERDGALDCIECGRCDTACPSRIPLLQRYREAKRSIGEMHTRRQAALAARERYQTRQQRLARDEVTISERQAERSSSLVTADAVAAAIARAKAKRGTQPDKPKP
ncbi:MAG TPA: 4Fe-4S dicluster domain-containing protein [Xanthomonadaceae bacterium]|jgi:electron transport complex protein RnfC|nr:4Fe-4S dicluster domain-containing protein [Xanthomonadaceae bacterium]